MELNDLKNAWKNIPSDKELNEVQIKKMIGRKTGNLINRIDRNVKTGFILLFVFIVLVILDDFVVYPVVIDNMENSIQIPPWLMFLGILSNILIVITFFYFALKYYRVKRNNKIIGNLRETLVKIIETLNLYKKMFYLALLVLSVVLVIQFVSAMYLGVSQQLVGQQLQFSDVSFSRWILFSVVGLAVLVVLVGGVFLLFRWGFNRLYGTYINKLENTLNELDEIDN